MIGREPYVTPLVLIMGEDFDYTLRNKDGSQFPAGTSFQLIIGETSRTFAFNGAGTIASMRIESTDITKALNWLPYRIASKSTATTPSTDKVLVHGDVRVRGN